jgi:hypothetical protein
VAFLVSDVSRKLPGQVIEVSAPPGKDAWIKLNYHTLMGKIGKRPGYQAKMPLDWRQEKRETRQHV